MDENNRPLGAIRQNVNCRKPYQRIHRNTHYIAAEVEVYAWSLHDEGRDVNFVILFPYGKQTLPQDHPRRYAVDIQNRDRLRTQ